MKPPQIEKSLADATKAVELAPDNTSYRLARADYLLILKRFDQWESDFAILDKTCSGGWYRTQKANGKYVQGKIEEAVAIWNENKNSCDLLKAAYGCLQLGDANRSITFCDRALSCQSTDEIRGRFLKARALDALGNLPSALHEGEVALKIAKAAPAWKLDNSQFLLPDVSVSSINQFCNELKQQGVKAK